MKLQTANSEALKAVQKAAENGLPPEVSVVRLHDMGFSVIGSMQIIREVYKTSLSEAKKTVANHPVWAKLSESANSLHDELEKCVYDTAKHLPEEVESVSVTYSRTFSV